MWQFVYVNISNDGHICFFYIANNFVSVLQDIGNENQSEMITRMLKWKKACIFCSTLCFGS